MPKSKNGHDVRIELRAVVYRHQRWWIAHCLELDLVAEGKTPAAALQDLIDISVSQVETAKKSGDLESIFRAAPPEIWAMFSRACDAPPMKRRPLKSVERFEAREAALA
jgi:hypothetical protein